MNGLYNYLVVHKTVLLALFTVIGSGTLSAFISQRYTFKSAELSFKRKKLEELFYAVHYFSNMLASYNIPWLGVARGDYDYNKALDLVAKYNKDEYATHYPTMLMLVNLYFRELTPHLKEVIATREKINDAVGDLKKAYKADLNTEGFEKPIGQAIASLDKVNERFNDAMYKIASRHKFKFL